MSNCIINNIEFYDDKPTIDLSFKRLVAVGDIRSELRINGGENGSVSVRLENGDGTLTQWVNELQLQDAVVNHDGRTFLGVVRSISVSENINIIIES